MESFKITEGRKDKKTILGGIRKLKGIGKIAAILSLAPMGEGAFAGNENEKKVAEPTSIQKPATETKEKDYVYQIAPDTNVFKGNFSNKNFLKQAKKIHGGSSKINWKPDPWSDHSTRPDPGSHGNTCPGPENSATALGTRSDIMGGGHGRGARQSERIHKDADKMGLSATEYILWETCKTSHDPKTKEMAKKLEEKGEKILELKKALTNKETPKTENPDNLLVEKK